MNVLPLNERVLVAEFYPEISAATLKKVQALKKQLTDYPFRGLQEIWSSYHSVAIAYDPNQISFDEVRQHLLLPPKSHAQDDITANTTVEIPIHYHRDTPDILTLSESLGLSPQDITTLHQAPTYQVAMLGFQPGFPFLIGLPEKLHHPRKRSPSLRVPKGSVAIGGGQTGIYPADSPGGWYVIGHTELNLFTRPDQFLLLPGHHVSFVAP